MRHIHDHLLTARTLAALLYTALLTVAAGVAAAPIDVPELPDIVIDGNSADWADAGLLAEVEKGLER